mgnify:CR=1 FL=1
MLLKLRVHRVDRRVAKAVGSERHGSHEQKNHEAPSQERAFAQSPHSHKLQPPLFTTPTARTSIMNKVTMRPSPTPNPICNADPVVKGFDSEIARNPSHHGKPRLKRVRAKEQLADEDDRQRPDGLERSIRPAIAVDAEVLRRTRAWRLDQAARHDQDEVVQSRRRCTGCRRHATSRCRSTRRTAQRSLPEADRICFRNACAPWSSASCMAWTTR